MKEYLLIGGSRDGERVSLQKIVMELRYAVPVSEGSDFDAAEEKTQTPVLKGY